MGDARTDCFCEPPAVYGGYMKIADEGHQPCYLPQEEEPSSGRNAPEQQMGPLGPWATGRVDWGPLKGLTGTRPIVDRYSITRYSLGEWRDRNAEVINSAGEAMHWANIGEFNARRCMEQAAASVDKNQLASTARLSQRAHDVYRWKIELERAISAMGEEINLLESQRQRLKISMGVLRMPESIAGECLSLRSTRLEGDLVRDDVEEELMKEVALTYEVRDVMNRLLEQMETQLTINKAAKQDLEMDWSDKKEAHEIEAINIGLRNTSPTILFRPGATRIPDGQSTPASWEATTRERLDLCEIARAKSHELRQLLDCMLTDIARDLRTQADRVDLALTRNIALTDDCRQRLENDLVQCLKRTSDTERLIGELKNAIRCKDQAMKVAQTRLDNRLYRVRTEFCRDAPQYGLIDEVKSIAESVAALSAQLGGAMAALGGLAETRAKLEREVMVKRKTLSVDRDRCQLLRGHYPSSTALTGY